MHDVPSADGRMSQAYQGRRVLLTGHTGFKGGWLAVWLRRLGADIAAVALPPEDGGPSMFEAAGIEALVDHRIGDIGDPDALARALDGVEPEIVFHLAAQSLVRPSYARPIETFRTNVLGTAAVLEAVRQMPSVRAVVIVTSDKCYDNRETVWGYREGDPMGGADPYSASKGCAELVASAYRRSFFAGEEAPLIATVRAGNVFGGGDWATDRIVPDIVRAATSGTAMVIRNPAAVRPWQHVLEPLSGYLMLGARLLDGDRSAEGGWNFGPDPEGTVDVGTLARMVLARWGADAPRVAFGGTSGAPPEAGILRLDTTKARFLLGWRPRLSLPEAIATTVDWYKAWAAGAAMRAVTEAQIAQFETRVERPLPQIIGEPACA